MLHMFGRAFLLGFSVAAPVGPIGILCIRRTLSDGRAVGLACGLGAATADALYGLVAALGLGALSHAALGGRPILALIGAIYLAFMGARTLVARPASAEADVPRAARAWRAWASTLFLTLTNPMTVVFFAAAFSAISAGAAGGPLFAPALVAGVFLGSASWWLLLSSAVSRLRARVRDVHLLWINRASGGALIAFAAWALLAAVR